MDGMNQKNQLGYIQFKAKNRTYVSQRMYDIFWVSCDVSKKTYINKIFFRTSFLLLLQRWYTNPKQKIMDFLYEL